MKNLFSIDSFSISETVPDLDYPTKKSTTILPSQDSSKEGKKMIINPKQGSAYLKAVKKNAELFKENKVILKRFNEVNKVEGYSKESVHLKVYH